eukprot:359639-Chlamydomonas_euryale.AAC.5
MTVGSGAIAAPGAGASGSAGGPPSRVHRETVVKQMLNSWMMDGYSELKSSSATILSCRPFLGSSTRPPAYCGPLDFLLPPAGPPRGPPPSSSSGGPSSSPWPWSASTARRS